MYPPIENLARGVSSLLHQYRWKRISIITEEEESERFLQVCKKKKSLATCTCSPMDVYSFSSTNVSGGCLAATHNWGMQKQLLLKYESNKNEVIIFIIVKQEPYKTDSTLYVHSIMFLS